MYLPLKYKKNPFVRRPLGYSKFKGFVYQVQVGMKRSTKLHVLDKVGSLAFIWSDHSNLLRLHSSTEESGGNLLYISSFSPVEETTLVYRLYIGFEAVFREMKLSDNILVTANTGG